MAHTHTHTHTFSENLEPISKWQAPVPDWAPTISGATLQYFVGRDWCSSACYTLCCLYSWYRIV